MQIEVLPARPEEQLIVASLFQLYAYDFGEFLTLELDADGRFPEGDLSLFWLDPGRYPFLVRVDGGLAGFVLVKRGSEISGDVSIWDMAQFFVIRGHRRRGVGTVVAHEVWKRFPGRWEVRVMELNAPACDFWRSAATAFAGSGVEFSRFEKDAGSRVLFSFESKAI